MYDRSFYALAIQDVIDPAMGFELVIMKSVCGLNVEWDESDTDVRARWQWMFGQDKATRLPWNIH